MSADAWQAILAAWADIDGRIVRDIPKNLGAGPTAGDVLIPLRADLADRLATLQATLQRLLFTEHQRAASPSGDALEYALTGAETPHPGPADPGYGAFREANDEAEQVLVPIAIHVDERVLRSLPAPLRLRWEHLQRVLIHSDDGGDVFYVRIEALIKSAKPSPLVVEAYRFCLGDGFLGRYAREPGKIDEYEHMLATRLPAPERPLQASEPPSQGIPPVQSPVLYYALALAAVALMPFVAKLLSNLL